MTTEKLCWNPGRLKRLTGVLQSPQSMPIRLKRSEAHGILGSACLRLRIGGPTQSLPSEELLPIDANRRVKKQLRNLRQKRHLPY
jgi:hypothetical protein